jgi:isoleucyl-tRNA synthetase
MTVARILAPFAPFCSDRLYKDLGGLKDSVHLDEYPVVDETMIDTDLEARMSVAQKITSMVLALRRKVNIRVRQPLAKMMIPAVNDEQKKHIIAVSDLIKNEVNVKEIEFIGEQGVLVKKAKCNFRVMGKKFGKLMKPIAAYINTLSQKDIALLETEGQLTFEVSGQTVTVDTSDVDIISEDIPGWLVANEGNLTVALEVTLTPELKKEGMARELINRIQNLRKETGLEITDRIIATVAPHPETDEAIRSFGDMIRKQVLANQLNIADNDGTETEFDDFKLNIKVEKDNR